MSKHEGFWRNTTATRERDDMDTCVSRTYAEETWRKRRDDTFKFRHLEKRIIRTFLSELEGETIFWHYSEE